MNEGCHGEDVVLLRTRACVARIAPIFGDESLTLKREKRNKA